MKTIIVSIYGNVQGVGFRYFVQRTAMAHKIPGSVKNEPDGSVTIKATGQAEALAVFLKAIEVGNGFSKVSCTSVEEVPLIAFDDFRIEY